MKKIMRLSVAMVALLGMLAFAACDSDSDGGATCDPACDANACETCVDGTCTLSCAEGEVCDGAGNCVEPTPCDPECDAMACEECVDGECASTCEAGFTCDGEGTCVEDTVPCDPECDANACEECVGGVCETTCEEGEVCDGAGACITDLCADATCDTDGCETCDPATGDCVAACDADACEECDGAGMCVTSCDTANCETCDGAGGCVAACDADLCQQCDGAGGCETTCAAGEVCDGAGTCTAGCDDEDGFCPGAIINELAIAGSDCCYDYDGDEIPDNGIAGLLDSMGPMIGISLEDLNATVAEALAAGDIIVLFEFIGVDDVTTDAYVDANFYLGADADDPVDATDNFSGDEEFYVMDETLDEDGNPLITFAGGAITGGMLAAGPAQFIIPVQIAEYGIDIQLTVDAAQMEAEIGMGTNLGYTLANGILGGYVQAAQIFAALNSFVGANCTCLGITGDILLFVDDAWTCAEIPGTNTCDDQDEIESLCPEIGSYCNTVVSALPLVLDLDTDEDGTADAATVGATFGATSADLLGPMPAVTK